MPVSIFDNFSKEKKEMIADLSIEINFFYEKMKQAKEDNDSILDCIDFLKKYDADAEDDSKNLRRISHFITIQAYENSSTLKDLLQSDSGAKDMPLMKKGINDLKEGCKQLIGFYINQNSDTLIRKSLLYKIHKKVQNDYPDIYEKTEVGINDFRKKIEDNNIKDIRDELIHYQKKQQGDFDPFSFTDTALGLDCNAVYLLLSDYRRFLRLLTNYCCVLMKLGYK